MALYDHKLLNRSVFLLNPEDDDRESVSIMTEFFSTGEPGVIVSAHEITLDAHGSAASFHLNIDISPEKLRKLADQLEAQRAEAIAMTQLTIDKTH